MAVLTSDIFDVVYRLSATCEYNSERAFDLDDLLVEFLRDPKDSFNIESEFKKLIELKSQKLHGNLLGTFFSNYDKLRSTLYYPDEYEAYLKDSFKPFLKEFKQAYGFDLQLYTLFSSGLNLIVQLNARNNKFNWDNYEFENKEEYTNISFIKIPDVPYIKKWEKITTIKINEIINPLTKHFPLDSIIKITNELTFNITDVKDSNFNLYQKPILKISDEEVIVLRPRYALTSINQRLSNMFNLIPEYRNKKGLLFERKVLKLLDTVPKAKLFKNIHYGKYETDGIINFNNTSWFIECSSHQPNDESFLKNEVSIIEDLKKTIDKCDKQALRAIHNRNHPNIKKSLFNNEYGVFIVLDGFYPNLNMELPFPLIPKTHEYRRLIINYFDLSFLMRQPEKDKFEYYLKWRTQKKFPINGIDELDVWNYYLNTKINNLYNINLSKAQEKGSGIFYIGDRFNDKRYLNKLR